MLIKKIYTHLKRIPFLKNILFQLNRIIKDRGIVFGKNNKILFKSSAKFNNKIYINGNNNLIKINNSEIVNCDFKISGNNCKILVDNNSHLNGTELYVEGDNILISIGENCFVGKSHLAAVEDNSQIKLEKNCLISSNVHIRTSDSHSIFYKENNKRINYAKSIYISEKVWIGEGARILKGVHLGHEIIVSSGSIVTKSFKNKNVIIGGIPAKVLKENIFWQREL
jgi:acetyltransferase-like isoleucine patch superfamily enzyme